MDIKKKILLIDDDEALTKVYKNALEEAGFEFISANSGPAGVEKAGAEKPDLILLDVMIGKSNGPETIIQLKNDEKVKAIPVIFLTNIEGEQNTTRFAAEAGAIDYLIKSETSMKELIAKVKKALGIKE
ncbi:MAG: response regulator [Patescibacteria group bacterium]